MKSYRLVVRQQGRVVGHFEMSGQDVLYCKVSVWHGRYLVSTAGIQCELLVSDSGKRILKSGPEEMKILMREKCFCLVTSLLLMPDGDAYFYLTYGNGDV